MRVLRRGLRHLLQTSLQVLSLSSNALHSGGARVLADVLSAQRQESTPPEGLCGSTPVQRGSEHVDQAAPAPYLHELRLAGNNLCDFQQASGGAIDLFKALPPLPALRTLDLSQNRLSHAAITALAQCVGECPTLQVLALNSNRMRGAAAVQLARGLRRSKTISKLELRSNFIDSRGAEELAKSLASESCALRELDLRDNLLTHWGRVCLIGAVFPGSPQVQEALRDLGIQESCLTTRTSTPRMPMQSAAVEVTPPCPPPSDKDPDLGVQEAASEASHLSRHISIPALPLEPLPAALLQLIKGSDDASPLQLTSDARDHSAGTASQGGFSYFQALSKSSRMQVLF